MSVAASAISQLAYRVDALYAQVSRMSADAETERSQRADEGLASNEQTARAVDPDTLVAKTDLADTVADLKASIEDAKGQNAAGLRKERGIIEAVLTQKLEKRISDRVDDLSERAKAANPGHGGGSEVSQEDVDALSNRIARVSTEVDRQTRYLSALDGKLRGMIERSVREILAEETSRASAPAASVPSDPADSALEDAPSLDDPRPREPEASGDIDDSGKGEGDGRSSDRADDEIDMVKADESSDDKPAKKARAPPRKRK